MYRALIYTCLIFNFVVFFGGLINYNLIVVPLNDDMKSKIDEDTASLALKSSGIIDSYSVKEKIDNLEKIVFLYKKIVKYLDPLEKFMFEANEALLHYSYVFLFISIANISLIFFILKLSPK